MHGEGVSWYVNLLFLMVDVFNEESSGGILAVKVDKRNERMELAWSHSTPSMALGYWHGKKKSCKVNL